MMHIDKFHSRMKCVDIYQNEIRKIIQKTSNKRWDSTKFFWDGLIRLVFIWVTLLLLNNCQLDLSNVVLPVESNLLHMYSQIAITVQWLSKFY